MKQTFFKRISQSFAPAKVEDAEIGVFVEIKKAGKIIPGKVMDRFYNERTFAFKKKGWMFLIAINFKEGVWETVEIPESKLMAVTKGKTMKAISTRKDFKTIVEPPDNPTEEVTEESLRRQAYKAIKGRFKIIKDKVYGKSED